MHVGCIELAVDGNGNLDVHGDGARSSWASSSTMTRVEPGNL